MFSLVDLLLETLECVIAPFMYLMLLVHVPPIRDCNASLIPREIKLKLKQNKKLKKIEFLTSLNILELRPYR